MSGCGLEGGKTKAADWKERQKERANELSAIAEAIAVLNDDDALDIFKSSLRTPPPKPMLLDVHAIQDDAGAAAAVE